MKKLISLIKQLFTTAPKYKSEYYNIYTNPRVPGGLSAGGPYDTLEEAQRSAKGVDIYVGTIFI